MRIVCDTNVIVSGLLFGGPPRQVLSLTSNGRAINYTSAALLRELGTVLRRAKFGLSASEVGQALRLFADTFEFVVPEERLQVIRNDPDDNRVLEAAIAAPAQCIVSGDSDLLDLGTFRGLPIVPPADFLDRLPS